MVQAEKKVLKNKAYKIFDVIHRNNKSKLKKCILQDIKGYSSDEDAKEAEIEVDGDKKKVSF